MLFVFCTHPSLKLVHGDLKPEIILLDSQLSCKIGDFGIFRLVSEELPYIQSLPTSTEPKGAFSYTDPEFQRTRVLTSQSDVYSFGLIILQLLTRKPTLGLSPSEVRNLLSSGQLELVLDSSTGEWPETVARRLVDFGLQCCEMKSQDRPKTVICLRRDTSATLFLMPHPAGDYARSIDSSRWIHIRR